MSKKKAWVRIGRGGKCPKCREAMERREHRAGYVPKPPYYFKWWDYCRRCGHVQHFEQNKVLVAAPPELQL